MKAATILIALPVLLAAGCVVNPDADRAFKEDRRRNDSLAAVERGVVQPTPDTGQHDMPVIKPTAPVESDMPVVNPADTSAHKPL